MLCPCHALTMPFFPRPQHSTAVYRRPCCGLEKNGMVGAWHGRGMASVNQTRPHCVNQMGKTHSKPIAARHGRETACYAWIGLYADKSHSFLVFSSLLGVLGLFKRTRFKTASASILNLQRFLLTWKPQVDVVSMIEHRQKNPTKRKPNSVQITVLQPSQSIPKYVP